MAAASQRRSASVDTDGPTGNIQRKNSAVITTTKTKAHASQEQIAASEYTRVEIQKNSVGVPGG